MKNLQALLIASAALAGCTSLATRPYTEHDARIVGTWSSIYMDSDETSYGEKTYLPDGRACGFILENSMDGTHLTMYTSRWNIEDGRLSSLVVTSNDPGIVVGHTSVDEIVDVAPAEMTLHSLGTGHTYKRYRVPEDRGEKICALRDLTL